MSVKMVGRIIMICNLKGVYSVRGLYRALYKQSFGASRKMQTPIVGREEKIMSVRYTINSELGIVFIFCDGVVSDTYFFKMMKSMYADKSYRPEMHRLVDFLSASEDFSSMDEIHSNMKYRDKIVNGNVLFGHTILLTRSKSMSLFMKALETDSKIKYYAVESLGEVSSLLGFQERKQEIIDFYNQSKYEEKN